jgi:co-chaperonin GroES (HSP10)
MSAIGKFVEIVKIDSMTGNEDLMHAKVVSIGNLVEMPIKKGDKVIVSTVKKVQDYIEGETHYWVDQSQIVHKL